MSKSRTPRIFDEIAGIIIENLSLNERVTIANLKDDQIEFINKPLAEYIQSKSKQWAVKQGEQDSREAEAIVKEIWNRLRENTQAANFKKVIMKKSLKSIMHLLGILFALPLCCTADKLRVDGVN